MFVAKKDVSPAATPANGKVDTIIGQEAEIKGTLTSTGIIRIDGKVDGEIIHEGDIMIGETGNITADVKARNVTVAGAITGNVDATGKLELLASARVTGDISIGALVIGEGAVFRGTSETKGAGKAADRPDIAKAAKKEERQ